MYIKMNRGGVVVVIGLLISVKSQIIAQEIEVPQTPADRDKVRVMRMDYPPEITTARTHRAKGEYDEAIQSYKGAIEKYPNTVNIPIAYAEMGECYKGKGEDAEAKKLYDRAIPLFEKIIASSNKQETAYYQAISGLARIYLQLEDLASSIEYSNRLLELEGIPAFAMIELGACWMSLGRTYEKQEELKDAVSAYREALELFTKAGGPLSNISNARVRLAACYRGLQAWKAAIKEIQKEIDMSEKYLKDHPNLSESRRKLHARGVKAARMEIKEMKKMQGSYVLPVTVGLAIVITIGGLSLLLLKKASSRVN